MRFAYEVYDSVKGIFGVTWIHGCRGDPNIETTLKTSMTVWTTLMWLSIRSSGGLL